MMRSITCGLLLLLGATTANAHYAVDYSNCCRQQQCCDADMSFSADLLYWKVSSEGDAFLRTIENQNIEGNPLLGTQDIENTYYIDHSWRPGVRLKLQSAVDCCGWDLYGEWTWYRNEKKRSVSLAVPDGIVSNLLVLIFPRSPIDSAVGFSPPFVLPGGAIDPVQAKHTFGYNRFDIGITKNYQLCDGFMLVPHTALTYLHTYDDLNISTRTAAAPPATDLFRQVYRTSHHGVGIDVGIDGIWSCTNCTLIKGGFGLTGLADRRKSRFSYQEDVNAVSPTGAPYFNYQCTDEWMGTLIPHVNVAFGYEGCSCGYEYDIHIGYEYQLLIDQNLTGTGNNLIGSSVLNPNNTHLHGMNVGFGISF